ncbi:MAG: TatD family hydrolase [Bacteriovoracaceae bacterium]|nr:TatD family hydrolase [Bacteriovoracaceae bacterium]
MKIVETHCHLDYLKERPIEETLQKCLEAGVEKIVTIGVDPANIDAVMTLAESHPYIWCTQGIHPHDVKDMNDEVFNRIKSRAQHPKVVAIGEIGLDYFYNHSVKEDQKKWFRTQLELAVATDKPVVIHSRDADEDMIEFLSEFGPQLKKKGVVHSFSSGLKLAETALAQGFFLGFNGMVTFPKAENVRDAVRLCPLEQLILETDSPFLTPVPHRGKENAPFYLPFILKKVAEIKSTSEEVLMNQAWLNSHRLFSI